MEKNESKELDKEANKGVNDHHNGADTNKIVDFVF